MIKLKCIKEVPSSKYVASDVIVGNVYPQFEGYNDSDDYYIKDESGRYRYYDKSFFEIVS